MRDLPKFDRRKVLKATGAGLATSGAFTLGASATSNPDQNPTCEDCMDPELIAEDSQYFVSRVDKDGSTVVYWIHKDTGRVSYRTFDRVEGTLDKNSIGVEGDQIEPTNHEEIFERSDLWQTQNGDCGGHIYDKHYTVGLSVETGDSLNDYPSGVVEGALCAVLGARGGVKIAALAAIVCYTFGYFFLDHIDFSGYEFTLAVSDCHVGVANEEAVCSAVGLDYTSDSSDLTRVKKLSGPHLELGKDIEDHLP